MSKRNKERTLLLLLKKVKNAQEVHQLALIILRTTPTLPPPPPAHRFMLTKVIWAEIQMNTLKQPHKDASVDVFSEQVLLNIQVKMRGLQYAFGLITENTEA